MKEGASEDLQEQEGLLSPPRCPSNSRQLLSQF